MSDNNKKPNDNSKIDISRDNLDSSDAILALGIAVAKLLSEDNVVSLFISEDLSVQIAKPGELELDSLPEEMAIRILYEEKNYSDEELEEYLKGRDARFKLAKR